MDRCVARTNGAYLRLRGFVPVNARMLATCDQLPTLLRGQSVVVFDDRHLNPTDGNGLCVGILKMMATAHRVCAIVVTPGTQTDVALIAGMQPRDLPASQAAERRPLSGPARRVPFLADARAASWFQEGCRFRDRGRHAAAERALRSACAAFERRGDALRSADAMMVLGRLLLTRGRAAEAERQFCQAADKYRVLNAGILAVTASSMQALRKPTMGGRMLRRSLSAPP